MKIQINSKKQNWLKLQNVLPKKNHRHIAQCAYISVEISVLYLTFSSAQEP